MCGWLVTSVGLRGSYGVMTSTDVHVKLQGIWCICWKQAGCLEVGAGVFCVVFFLFSIHLGSATFLWICTKHSVASFFKTDPESPSCLKTDWNHCESSIQRADMLQQARQPSLSLEVAPRITRQRRGCFTLASALVILAPI